VSQTVFYLAQYLLELTLLDSKMNQYLPSLQASAALHVALKVNQFEQSNKQGQALPSCWSKALQEVSKYQSV